MKEVGFTRGLRQKLRQRDVSQEIQDIVLSNILSPAGVMEAMDPGDDDVYSLRSALSLNQVDPSAVCGVAFEHFEPEWINSNIASTWLQVPQRTCPLFDMMTAPIDDIAPRSLGTGELGRLVEMDDFQQWRQHGLYVYAPGLCTLQQASRLISRHSQKRGKVGIPSITCLVSRFNLSRGRLLWTDGSLRILDAQNNYPIAEADESWHWTGDMVLDAACIPLLEGMRWEYHRVRRVIERQGVTRIVYWYQRFLAQATEFFPTHYVSDE